MVALLRDFKSRDIALRNAQWECILSIMMNDVLGVVARQIPRLFSLLGDIEDGICPFHSTIVSIFAKLSGSERNRKKIVETGLMSKLAELLEKFPRHTIFHKSVLEFVMESLNHGKYANGFLDEMIPAMARLFTSDRSVEERASAWNFFVQLGSKYSEISGLRDVVMSNQVLTEEFMEKVNSITELTDFEYGGEAPNRSASGTMSLTGEQYRLLVQFIRSGGRGQQK
jgi:hypothetical protein